MGTSAGAIIQGSFLVRGRPDKPLLMAPGRTTGFGFLKNVAINPHLTSAKRDAELINVADAHPSYSASASTTTRRSSSGRTCSKSSGRGASRSTTT